jgi:hypothetical protein
MTKTRTILAVALAATTFLGGVAHATDGIVADGDVGDAIFVNPGGNPQNETLAFGEVCPGDAISPDDPNVNLAVVRGNNNSNRFADAATVTFTVLSITNADVANGGITLSGWNSAAPNTVSEVTSNAVSLAVPSDAGAGAYAATVNYRATGPEEGGGTNTINNHALSVSWTVLAVGHEACETVVPDPCASVVVPDAPVFDHTPNGANGWDTSAPAVIATSTDATVGYSTVPGGPYSATPPALVEGEQTVHAIATSLTCNKVSGEASEVYKLDTVNPSIEITSPPDASSTLASTVTVSGTTSDATSGVAGVTVNGAASALDVDAGTFSRSGVVLSCGSNTISAEATDNAGRTASDSISVYRRCFTGSFLQPLDPNGVLNKAKLGRVVPVKLSITANDGGSVPSEVYFGVRKVSCTAGAQEDVVESYAAGSSNTGNTFRLSDGAWIYNLDTTKLPGAVVGNCYQLDVYVGGTVDAAGMASGGVAITNGSVRIQLTK